MSESTSVKGYNNRTTQIACPKCAYVTEQQCSKLRKLSTLICPTAARNSRQSRAKTLFEYDMAEAVAADHVKRFDAVAALGLGAIKRNIRHIHQLFQ